MEIVQFAQKRSFPTKDLSVKVEHKNRIVLKLTNDGRKKIQFNNNLKNKKMIIRGIALVKKNNPITNNITGEQTYRVIAL